MLEEEVKGMTEEELSSMDSFMNNIKEVFSISLLFILRSDLNNLPSSSLSLSLSLSLVGDLGRGSSPYLE